MCFLKDIFISIWTTTSSTSPDANITDIATYQSSTILPRCVSSVGMSIVELPSTRHCLSLASLLWGMRMMLDCEKILALLVRRACKIWNAVCWNNSTSCISTVSESKTCVSHEMLWRIDGVFWKRLDWHVSWGSSPCEKKKSASCPEWYQEL